MRRDDKLHDGDGRADRKARHGAAATRCAGAVAVTRVQPRKSLTPLSAESRESSVFLIASAPFIDSYACRRDKVQRFERSRNKISV
jgi:hypothetical protein